MANELMRKAMQQIAASKKSADQMPWTPDQPHPQPYYAFDGRAWEPHQPETGTGTGAGAGTGSAAGPDSSFSRLALYSWNIDFMLPHAEERMRSALAHLEPLVTATTTTPTAAVVIFLQECVASDLATIAAAPWVRDRFYLSDLTPAAWESGHYGTAALVDRRLPAPRSVFRVHYAQTRMERDALFVDLLLHSSSSRDGGSSDDGKGKEKKLIRLCNTHLESLALDPPLRPAQVKLFAGYMHGSNDDDTTTTAATTGDGKQPPKAHGAVAAGDFNAIQPFDRTLHADNGLRDAFLERGGREDTPEAYTWGQQAPTGLRNMYGCSRMDKVYFCGGLKLLKFERFGADVQLEGGSYKEEFEGFDIEKPWITDHLGIMAEFDVVD
ncbi:hypothetical protein SLS62_001651 [Diatrype stigma]|uniref:Endonuclease/exonuclease/phosphatase domain-containing protein n=1 Tax=Diatrype stigma TaxID=117547 RepID=A0AAN9YWH4_9PEZI